MILCLFLFGIAHSANIDLSVRDQDNVETIDFGIREEFPIKRTTNTFRYTFYKTDESPSRTDVLLHSVLPAQDINFVVKTEYYKENFRRNRFGFGVKKTYDIFGIEQFLTKEYIHRGDENFLFDTNLLFKWAIEEVAFDIKYAFLTNFDEIDYKYILARAETKMTDNLSVAIEIDRRWEERKKRILRLLLSVEI